MRTLHKLFIIAIVLMLTFYPIFANPNPSISISYTFRFENWNYFKFRQYQNSYNFYGLKIKPVLNFPFSQNAGLLIGLNLVSLGNLPSNAVAPAPAGLLGLGANYYSSNTTLNNSSITAVCIRDLHFYYKSNSFSLKIGRFSFSDGNELIDKFSPSLKFLKNTRISQRILGPFGFSYVERAFDGITFDYKPNDNTQLTFLYSKPTYGVFELSTANRTIDKINLYYFSFNKAIDKNTDFRLFFANYNDDRNLLKPSNRPNIRGRTNINNLGLHFIKVIDKPNYLIDFVGWYSYQWGKWGDLDNNSIKHSAYAYDLEIGYKIKQINTQPYFRVYYFKSSGDTNPNDNKHQTFFSFLPTPRIYALFPFYTLQNLQDFGAQLIISPSDKMKLKIDYNILNLSSSKDRWYQGGGAFNNSVFGYVYKNSFNQSTLANMLSLSINYELTKKTSINMFYSIANGRDIIKRIFDKNTASYFFVEYNHKF